MSDREAFLAAIDAKPDDDAPRLVYADWLEDHGEADEAAAIRHSVAIGLKVKFGARRIGFTLRPATEATNDQAKE